MGFKICWLGFSGKGKADVLSALRAADTGIWDEANENPMSVASLPNDWTIVRLNRFDHPLADDASIQGLSKDCTLVTTRVHEGIMASSAQLHKNGAKVWSIAHNAQEGITDLQAEGALPDCYPEISTRLTRAQDEDGEQSEIDYLFDVPIEVADAICGYRHDLCSYDWGEPHFTVLQERRSNPGWQFWKK